MNFPNHPLKNGYIYFIKTSIQIVYFKSFFSIYRGVPLLAFIST